jgi:lipoprotein-anchoring transpeptidase ErfK/SrfK
MHMYSTWKWKLVAAVAILVVTPNAARAQHTAPRDTGLILSSVAAAIAQPMAPLEDFSLVADLSDRKLYVMSGEDTVRSYLVSVGEPSYPTPAGEFRIGRMIWNPSWVPPLSEWARDKQPEPPGSPGNPMGRVKIFFHEPDYYIHGTGLVDSLGNARSHGCIRMRNVDAVELARMVMINSGEARSAEWFEQTIAEKGVSREVTLSSPVGIRIQP